VRAIEVERPGGDFVAVEREVPCPEENEVLVRVEACGICHGDAIVKEGQFPNLRYPRVPGHEVVGTIAQLGSRVRGWSIGQRIGVGWHGGHCFHCAACRAGLFGGCENALTTGISSDGGYAEYMLARSEVLVSIPDEFSSIEAAPLLCAGSTTLAAIKSSRAKGGDLIAIHGLGGLGHLATQWASKLGLRVCVLSRGKDKEDLARRLGARHFIDTDAKNGAKELAALGGARLIVCTAPNSQAIAALTQGLGHDGEMIIITYVSEPLELSPSLLMRGSRTIRGWVGGNMEDALRFGMLTGVRPIIESFPLANVQLAYERMMTSKVRLRGVLTP
jgi:alcohol dehydrogenase/propanol-preferring alcohol dehydrogenase